MSSAMPDGLATSFGPGGSGRLEGPSPTGPVEGGGCAPPPAPPLPILPEPALPETTPPEPALPEPTLPESTLPESTLPAPALPVTIPGLVPSAGAVAVGSNGASTGGASPAPEPTGVTTPVAGAAPPPGCPEELPATPGRFAAIPL